MTGSANPVVVLGRFGQVGSALSAMLGSECVALDRPEIDLTDIASVESRLERLNPRCLINAAAYTQVDQAETEQELVFSINAKAAGSLAEWCASRDIPYVYYSTDYVFPGTGERPWEEDDPQGPLNSYGRSKVEGERLVAAAGGKWLLFRTSWVYDARGKNFVNTMLRLGAEREKLRVVGDQYGAPTYAPHLARATLDALKRAGEIEPFPSGIYHVCNEGVTTWYGFAEAIFRIAREKGIELKVRELESIASSEYPVPARRPQNSRLNTEKAGRILGLSMPAWEQGLAECMNEYMEERI